MKLKNDGFSLIEILVAIALLSAVSLGVMKLSENMNNVSSRGVGSQDKLELYSQIRMNLDRSEVCKLSFGGITFKKSQVDQINSGEGVNVEVWRITPDGTARVGKHFSGTDPAFNKFGKLEIESMKLTFPNMVTNPSGNYDNNSSVYDYGVLAVELKNTKAASRDLRFEANYSMTTDGSGVTTITSCERIRHDVDYDEVRNFNHCISTNQIGNNTYTTSLCEKGNVLNGCWQYDSANNFGTSCGALIGNLIPNRNFQSCIVTNQIGNNSYTTSLCVAEDGIYGCWQYDYGGNYSGSCSKIVSTTFTKLRGAPCLNTNQVGNNTYTTSMCGSDEGLWGCWQYDSANNYGHACYLVAAVPLTKLTKTPCVSTNQIGSNTYTTSMCTLEDKIYSCWQYDGANNYGHGCSIL